MGDEHTSTPGGAGLVEVWAARAWNVFNEGRPFSIVFPLMVLAVGACTGFFRDDFLAERQGRRDVVDVRPAILRRLRRRQRVAGILSSVGQEHEPVRLSRRKARQPVGAGEMDRPRVAGGDVSARIVR